MSTVTVRAGAGVVPRPRATGWWGMLIVIATEATLFLLLVASYFYLDTRTKGPWPPDGLSDPAILKPLIATILLVASSVPIVLAGRAARTGAFGRVQVLVGIALALMVAFLVFQGILVHDSLDRFHPGKDAYASIFYALVGAHYAHTVVGALLAAWALLRTPRMTVERHLTLRVGALYWQFVNVLAVVVFLTLYLGPRA